MKKNYLKLLLVACTGLFASYQLNAANNITELKVDGDIVYFSLGEKSHSLPDCVAKDNEHLWSTTLATESGRAIYSMLVTALAVDKAVEVVSAGNCDLLGGIENLATASIVLSGETVDSGEPEQLGPLSVANLFQSQTYTGSGASRSLSLPSFDASSGSIAWFWARNADAYGTHWLFDTTRGENLVISPDDTSANSNYSGGNEVQYGNGSITVGSGQGINNSGSAFVGRFFKEAPGFLDIVTYTGNGGANLAVSHELGMKPGFILIKRLDNGAYWYVYSQALGASQYLYLNDQLGALDSSDIWANTEPTENLFYLGGHPGVNNNGATYIAYLFADNADTNLIRVGSYIGTGDPSQEITTGHEPEFLLIKNVDDSEALWASFDKSRGINGSTNNSPFGFITGLGESGAGRTDWVQATDTGFRPLVTNDNEVNVTGQKFIYLSIGSRK